MSFLSVIRPDTAQIRFSRKKKDVQEEFLSAPKNRKCA